MVAFALDFEILLCFFMGRVYTQWVELLPGNAIGCLYMKLHLFSANYSWEYEEIYFNIAPVSQSIHLHYSVTDQLVRENKAANKW